MFALSFRIFLIITSLSILLGCEDKEDEKQKYDMQYSLISNGDQNVTSISLETWTYFPDETITECIGKTKRKRYDLNDINHLELYDTIFIRPELKIYQNCTYSLKITLRFNEDIGEIKYRVYEVGEQTINDYNDSKFIFSWPEDSSKYEYYVNISDLVANSK